MTNNEIADCYAGVSIIKLVITPPHPAHSSERCLHCYHSGSLNAEFTMANGKSFTQQVCWSCVRKIYQNLHIIQSFFRPSLVEVLEEEDDEDVAF
jgi:hypothetical protein